MSGKTQVSTLLGPQLTLSGNNVSGPKGGADVVKNNIGNVCSGSVQELDWVVGNVMAAVDKAGATNNTITFFTSDNG